MDAQLSIRACLRKAVLDRIDELLGDALVARDQMRRQPIALEHLLGGTRPHFLAIQRGPLGEPARRADRVNTPEEPTEPLAILGGAELGPAPASALVDREAIAVALVQAIA